MGLSSKKSTTKATPYDPAAITAGQSALTSAYNANQPAIQGLATGIQGLAGDMIEKYRAGTSPVASAESYASDVLGGKYLDAGNPHLQGIVDTTNNSVQDRINALFSRAGQTGSSRQIGELGSRLAEAENALRYNDYGAERDRMTQAAGMAPGLAAGAIGPALAAAGVGAQLPLGSAQGYAGGLGSLLAPYGTQTTKQSGGLGEILGMGLQAAALFSDRRLKTDVRKVGKTDGGLDVFTYKYGGEGPTHMGVMAQDVKKRQPEALGGKFDGFMTVDYARVA